MHVAHQGQGHKTRTNCATSPARSWLPLPHKRQAPSRYPRHCTAQIQDRNLTMCTQSQPTRCALSTLRVTICCAHYRNRKAAFINGCFWHGHEGCKYFVLPRVIANSGRERSTATRNATSKSASNYAASVGTQSSSGSAN